MIEWISVKDRLPEDQQLVLAYQPKNLMYGVLQLHRCVAYDRHPMGMSTTHWMPLPQPPEGANGQL